MDKIKKKKSQKSNSSDSKKKKRIYTITFAILAIILIAILITIAVDNLLINNPFIQITKNTVQFEIPDVCTIIAGQLAHSIEDEDRCAQICRAECEVRESSFVESEFIERENNCNQCQCYCK